MTQFIQQTIIGISVGLAYAMVAMGLILLLRAAGVMNLAQGNLLAMGAYMAFLFLEKLEASSYILSVLGAIAIFVLVGIIFCSICFFPF